MNTFQLSCFLSVAEYLNFGRAAQQLHVTHPAVSQQIQSLEKELGVKLFRRTTRTVKLTEEGKMFLRDAQQITEISARAKRRFEGVVDGEMVETLTVGFYNFSSMLLMTEVLERLREVRQELHPRLQTIPFQHIYQMLEEGDLDAVVGFKESPGRKRDILYKEVAKSSMVCVCPIGHPLSENKELSLGELTKERLVLLAPPKRMPMVSKVQGKLLGERSPAECYFCESAEDISVLVTAGYGVSVLPEVMIPNSPMLAKIVLRDTEPVSFGIYHKSVQGNPALKAFIQCAKECFAGDMHGEKCR